MVASPSSRRDTVVVMDFGAQYAHLIARRVRECRVYSELIPHTTSALKLREMSPRGVILSGGPASVYAENAPVMDRGIFELDVPILGICYGLQLMVHLLGGTVIRSARREYGRAELHLKDRRDIFKSLGGKTTTWMSHGDAPTSLPDGFDAIAYTENSPLAAIASSDRRVFGVQFHPEVKHTPQGSKILKNFLFEVCRCKPSWNMGSFIEEKASEITKQVGSERVLCAISGGVDSTTTAVLIHKAVGHSLTCIFIDHGLLRQGEREEVSNALKDILGSELILIDASERFLAKLQGISDPEQKRKIIGEEFIRVFEEQSLQYGPFQWLAQGTLYPDVIESAAAGGPASRIKSHHNVAALPSGITFKLLEPLRELYKDEVRKIALLLGLPRTLYSRHPFPGPGLAVRIIGEVTDEKLRICRAASGIVEEELKQSDHYGKVWQAFALVGDDKATGVLGDERSYGYIVTVRIVTSTDAMTADWYRLPQRLIGRISSRITNEVPGVTWVTYAVSSKPPATIEPQ